MLSAKPLIYIILLNSHIEHLLLVHFIDMKQANRGKIVCPGSPLVLNDRTRYQSLVSLCPEPNHIAGNHCNDICAPTLIRLSNHPTYHMVCTIIAILQIIIQSTNICDAYSGQALFYSWGFSNEQDA